MFYVKGIQVESFMSLGVPYFHKSLGAKVKIGRNFRMNNGFRYADSGIDGRCRIDVRDSAELVIGDNVGISNVTITCHRKITIGNNVIIGVGTQIRDTDNHSLSPDDRLNGLDWANKATAPVVIGDNVFIGAGVIILKNVTIGRNSIIGAGSVVTRNVDEYSMWAENPARFIKHLKHNAN